jgi:hypothetical protein
MITADIAFVFSIFSLIGVILLSCQNVYKVIAYIKVEGIWMRIFGNSRLKWLTYAEPEDAFNLCKKVM